MSTIPWPKIRPDRQIHSAEQILIGSLLMNPGRLTRYEQNIIYHEEPLNGADFEHQQWKTRYFSMWGGKLTHSSGLSFIVPENICVRFSCGTILSGDTSHLMPMLDDFGLANWFMESGVVLSSRPEIYLPLPPSWRSQKGVMEKLFSRFDAFADVKGFLSIQDVGTFKDVIFPNVIPSKRYKFKHLNEEMHDVSKTSTLSVGIQKVGIRQVPIPLNIHLKDQIQPTIAKASIYTDLSEDVMGSHLSRLLEVLDKVSCDVVSTDLQTMELYLNTLKERLNATNAYLKLRFPILLSQLAPVTGIPGHIRYECTLSGEIDSGDLKVFKTIRVPYMSACICSKSISLFNAHCQRSFADVTLLLKDSDVPFEELVEIVEHSCSAPIRATLKREDEKFITEQAYDRAGFVETISRHIAKQLDNLRVRGWLVVCEHEESLHQHNAVALIRGGEYIP